MVAVLGCGTAVEGTQPQIVGCISNKINVLLQGRVPVGIFGPVKKGDLMVSAGNGRAKPATDPKLGSVIGKALEDFDGEEGVIEIVVGRL
jgi:hypothetical protein